MADKILMVEDDYALAMGTEYALSSEGYEVVKAENLAKAREAVDESIDLILLDVMLPDGSGYDFCKEIRDKGIVIPIIFLTAMSEEINIVQGLSLGADDYIAKPYRVKELTSRISANIRRYRVNAKPTNIYEFGQHTFYIDEYKLKKGKENIDCTLSEMKILKLLVLNQGIVLGRSKILEKLFDDGESFVDDNTLSVYIKRLRDKLGDDADWIETVRGVGYTFRKRG